MEVSFSVSVDELSPLLSLCTRRRRQAAGEFAMKGFRSSSGDASESFGSASIRGVGGAVLAVLMAAEVSWEGSPLPTSSRDDEDSSFAL